MIKRLFRNIPLLLAVFGMVFAALLTGCDGSGSPDRRWTWQRCRDQPYRNRKAFFRRAIHTFQAVSL